MFNAVPGPAAAAHFVLLPFLVCGPFSELVNWLREFQRAREDRPEKRLGRLFVLLLSASSSSPSFQSTRRGLAQRCLPQVNRDDSIERDSEVRSQVLTGGNTRAPNCPRDRISQDGGSKARPVDQTLFFTLFGSIFRREAGRQEGGNVGLSIV